jgi:hypothetical protein
VTFKSVVNLPGAVEGVDEELCKIGEALSKCKSSVALCKRESLASK